MQFKIDFKLFLVAMTFQMICAANLKKESLMNTTQDKFEFVGKFNTPVQSHLNSHSNHRFQMKTAEYAAPSANIDGLKVATILNEKGEKLSKEENNDINMISMTERPNFLSTVISHHPTSIHTNLAAGHLPNSPTFDLDVIRRKQFLEQIPTRMGQGYSVHMDNQVIHSPIPTVDIVHTHPITGIQATQPMLNSAYTNPMASVDIHTGPGALQYNPQVVHSTIHQTIPVVTTNQLMFGQPMIGPAQGPHFNVHLNYNGRTVPHMFASNLPDLNLLDKRVKQIDSLDKSELKNLLKDLKSAKTNIESTNKSIFSSINRYSSQISVILDSLRDELQDTEKDLKSMMVEVPSNEKPYIMRELEDEYTRSLNGYTINKDNYLHLKHVDPREIQEISNSVKNTLSANNDFYLHSDYELV